ncbi:pyruvate dehydrogenase E2 component (dihydrolipoamide acetyltransferase) [Aeromicrobium sp. SORGH_AS981]|uniref:2-oxoglutarate dehydrogenase, E2 component, dihydrolipoamide succinyltransferase n=1 Tax=Aeromicrobium sp. SORGH_AS_0981 TaxID=3041802 RepID=UPI0028636F57|nr:2-oxoglutarate dehydrogenase, E2 component, dihydrolipoamide succinyltransferase [Aeromicrobium sp. SORGH_AS_0981]MDR6119127.1 pyruvate dehydrogenase E2 component (dihydrolipoamide acetyltransferase) [Aeromicrobium sp. SORGH_AS_0981]
MATTVTLPELGESVTEGTVTTWLKNVGDTVEVDEPLLEISTDKVDTEIPSPVAGTILEIKVEEDETVEVGADLAVIGDADESPSDAGGEAPAEPEETEDADVEEGSSDEASAEQPGEEPARESDGTPVNQHGEEPHLETQSTGEGTEVTLPELGESVTEGTVTTWLKNVGDTVEVDEPLLEISTDKVDTEIPSPVAGTILEIKVEEDETVEVGAVLAVVGDPSAAGSSSGGSSDEAPSLDSDPAEDPAQAEELEEAAEAEKSQPEKAEEVTKEDSAPAPSASAPTAQPEKQAHPENEARPEPKQEAPQTSGASTQSGGDTYVTPIVRKLAKEHGVDLAAVTGSGVGGRIRKQDVLDAAKKAEEAAAPAPAETAPSAPAPAASSEPSPLRGKTEKLSRLRKVVASRLTESLQISAQLTQVHEVDVTEIARLRAKHKDAFLEREGVKLTFLPFFAKAAVEALKQYPTLNAALDLEAGTVTYPAGEHLGIAVDTERGLLVPTIKDAGDLSIAGLARKIADAAERTRTNKIKPDELSGGTFSITNLGSNGALFDTPIINQPQVAILGVGAVVKRPVVITDAHGSDSIAVRSMAYLALTYDHRLIDGADAGRFLTAVKERLQSGSFEGEL